MTDASTRDKLIDAAMRLFHEQGYAATGVATILREAGVNSGSMYYFFPTKEALLHGVLDKYETLLWPVVLQPAFDATQDPVERIFAVMAGYRQGLEMTSCGMGCPIGNLALEMSDTYPDVRTHLAKLFGMWCEGIRKCLDEASGALRADVDRESLAEFVLSVMEGAMMQARARRELGAFDRSIAHLRAYFETLRVER
ncbi:MAG: TetR/AcrR family transcriptional regulator [Phycisphaerales bacterium]|nr:TetR/AcrR family transcriptional regulator [Phycisphaerales bacterium]MCB9855255.1 TetR/AcrR family transcriptional regulator [Phycisphaerales bacterium]MCB9862848.1 TetR/AcrR family transcriptional regulator [Phycisphaerales bacterium]